MVTAEVAGLGSVCSGNKYESVEIPAFWQSPVCVYPSTVKAGLQQKPPWILNHLQPSSSFSLQRHVQTKRAGEGGENGIHTGKDAAVNFTRVNNMGNRPGSSSHNMLNSPAKGVKWTLISTKELLLNDGYSAPVSVLTCQSCLRYSVTGKWDVGGGATSLCSPCAPWSQSSWPLEYGLCVATARLSLHGGLDWVPSFSRLPTETPGWEDAESPLGSQGWIIENAAGAPHTGTIRQRVKENVQNIFKKKKDSEREDSGWVGRGDRGVEHRGRSRSNNGDCGTTATLHHWWSQCRLCLVKRKGWKIEKGPWECSCAADLPFKKFRGDNKYPNDSSVPLHPRLKLTRGPNVECRQQTQRSKQWGAEAASTAWLNGAGDFPSPPLPSRHSQSLLGKSGAPACKPGCQWVEGLERELESIWDHALFTCTATALRPPQRKGLRFHQCRLVSNLLLMATLHPILFPDLLDSIIVSIIKAISSKAKGEEYFHAWCQWVFLSLESLTTGFAQMTCSITLLLKWTFLSFGAVFMLTLIHTAKPESFVWIINHVKGRYPCKINFSVETSS